MAINQLQELPSVSQVIIEVDSGILLNNKWVGSGYIVSDKPIVGVVFLFNENFFSSINKFFHICYFGIWTITSKQYCIL